MHVAGSGFEVVVPKGTPGRSLRPASGRRAELPPAPVSSVTVAPPDQLVPWWTLVPSQPLRPEARGRGVGGAPSAASLLGAASPCPHTVVPLGVVSSSYPRLIRTPGIGSICGRPEGTRPGCPREARRQFLRRRTRCDRYSPCQPPVFLLLPCDTHIPFFF